jgi:hypothetical protein
MSRRPLSLGRTLAALACGALLLASTPARPDTCTGLSIATLTPVGAGTNPSGLAVGDFDRDGLLDVAVVNSGTSNVSILLGNGSGGFTTGPNSPIAVGATNPIDIAAGDVDRDGIMDLVVAFASGPARAEILRGLGGVDAGKFTATGPFTLLAIPSRIYLADLSNDAELDLILLRDAVPQRLMVYRGAPGLAFEPTPVSDFDLSIPNEEPSGAAVLDFNRDGNPDLAVAMRNRNWVRVYRGSGGTALGASPVSLSLAGVGLGPRDVAAGDVNRDGWPDLVTADTADSAASILLNTAGSSLTPQTAVTVGGVPTRVALVDLNHDGVLDLGALDDSGTPRVAALPGRPLGPLWFDPGTAAGVGSGPRGLAVGAFTADGRVDFVTALSSPGAAVVVENRSGTPCDRASFAAPPRSYFVGDRPVSTATADFDEDGRKDLVVVTASDTRVRILRNTAGDFPVLNTIGPLPSPPTFVATTDLNADGHADIVVARGAPGPGLVQVYLGDGAGGLAAGTIQSAGSDATALAIGDFNGDGAPDVAAAATGSAAVFVFLGDGMGGLSAHPSSPFGVGSAPRALVAAFLDADANLDLAVANFGSNDVTVLRGTGGGSFAPVATLPVGLNPQGIAAADVDGDLLTDLVTADNGSAQVSVIRRTGVGGFQPAVPYPVGTNPNAVALLDLAGDSKPDIAVATAASSVQTLSVLTNTAGLFGTPAINHTVRNAPQAITPFDADNDGLVDLAIPCSSSDAVVVLINRPPGPPVFSRAPRFAVRDKPRAAVTADLNGDGKLDLAVANTGDNSVSLMSGDGAGGLAQYTTLPAEGAEALVVADFNRDGKLDLAVSAPGAAPPAVKVFFGTGGGAFTPGPVVNVGGTPDDMVAGDFDLDGDADIALCDKVGPIGSVWILTNDLPVSFNVVSGPSVGNAPTAIVAADLDRDGDLDLAVANDDSDDVSILRNNPLGTFSVAQTLALAGGDTSPVALAVGDFNADGAPDLAAAAIFGDRIHVYQNDSGGTFVVPPATFDAPYLLSSLSVADVNRDGRPDLLAVAAGLSVLRGSGGMGFDPPQTVVAGDQPSAAVAADFNRDGRPDVAVVNEGSDDVTVLSSSACQAQRLEVTLQPSGCSLATSPPYSRDAEVTAYDDGGNIARCANVNVFPSIVPGTGAAGAVLSDPAAPDVVALGLLPTIGVASFTGSDSLQIDRPGRRYRLQFTAAGLAPVQTRSFTLGPSPQILGPNSVCPSSSGTYTLEGTPDSYDSYAWTLTPTGPPAFAYTPSVTLSNPPITGARTLDVTVRVDQCVVPAPSRSLFFGDLASVTIDPFVGPISVCVDCIGGSTKVIETGGGSPPGLTRRWGYRTEMGGTITAIPGETGETYTLKGANFPGPGTYYVVVTTTPECGLPLDSNERQVTVIAGSGTGEVLHLAALSRGGPSTGENKLLWVNTAAPLEVLIRWHTDGTNVCVSPASPTSPPLGPTVGETSIVAPAANAKDSFLHPALAINAAYCYSVFVRTGAGWSAGRTVRARPFDSTTRPGSSVKWAYATGGTAVAPPTVSGPALVVMSNDHTVHALTRGSAGGDWPASWMPSALAGVVHSRSPVVPFTPPLGTSDNVLFAGDDAVTGLVHAIDGRTGLSLPGWPDPQGAAITGAPGGMFVQYSGVRDAIFVGTRTTNAELRALDLTTGTLLEAYAGAGTPGPIGPINGSPAIDYLTRRLYFASWKQGSGHTLFCLQIQASPPVTPVFAALPCWSRDLGDITGSPVLVGNRVIVGTDDGRVISVDATTGLDDHTYVTLDGPVKGFLFPDRRGDDLIFATNTKVWSLSDVGPTMTVNWTWTVGGLNPSIVLFRPRSNNVYVGSRNGEIYELDFSAATSTIPPTHQMQVLGGGQGQVGAPSLDISRDLGPPETLIVGSEPGVVYLLELPFPPP